MKYITCLLTGLYLFMMAAFSQNVGIGTPIPSDKLHVNSGKIRVEDAGYPWISFVNGSALQGFIGAEGVNMRVGTWPTNTSGSLLLRTSGTDRMAISSSGNVGIGDLTPDVKLHVTGGTNAAPGGGGYLQLGNTNNTNVGFDNNEIQSRNNGVGSTLYLNYGGGQVWLGPKIIVTETAKVYRDLPLSTNADLLPIAYGKISSSGTVVSGTGNFLSQSIDIGEYRIVLLAESNVYANRDQYTIILTPNNGFGYMIGYDFQPDNSITVQVSRPHVKFTNLSCAGAGCLVSYIQNAGFYQKENCGFSLLVYKQ
jgi:hypothetical protein